MGSFSSLHSSCAAVKSDGSCSAIGSMVGKGREGISCVKFGRSVFAIFLLTTIGLALYPDLHLPSHWPAGEHSDRVYHVLAFASLATLAGFVWRLSAVSVTCLTMLAIALELAQIVTPGRQADVTDLLASLLGVVFGLSAVYLVNSARQRRVRVG